jgi:hypothetical protein
MKRMGWVVLALVAVLFASCSKEGAPGPAGPSGSQGSTGATGAAGIPRKMYITSEWHYETVYTTAWHSWSYQVILPWAPATNGVIVNFRGFETTVAPSECYISYWSVTGTTVTVYGWVWAAGQPYDFSTDFDVIAYDTLTTVQFNNMASSKGERSRRTPTVVAPVAPTAQP